MMLRLHDGPGEFPMKNFFAAIFLTMAAGVAAIADDWKFPAETVHKVNVGGARNVMQAALVPSG